MTCGKLSNQAPSVKAVIIMAMIIASFQLQCSTVPRPCSTFITPVMSTRNAINATFDFQKLVVVYSNDLAFLLLNYVGFLKVVFS